MLGLQILDVMIGLVFVYALLSLVTSAIVELVAQMFQSRGRLLRDAMTRILGDEELRDRLYQHPVIRSMCQGDRLPAYITPEQFARVTVDLVTGTSERDDDGHHGRSFDLAHLRQSLETSTHPHLARALRTILADVEDDATAIRQRIEQWYGDVMDRTSDWFRRRTASILLIVGLVVVVSLNVDTIHIMRTLHLDDDVRTTLVQRALEREEGERLDDVDIASLTNLIGWDPDRGEVAIPEKVSGLFVSWIAISLGAPFWFDILSRLASLRSNVAPKSEPESRKRTGRGARKHKRNA